jgi:toxin ParE1/3/4
MAYHLELSASAERDLTLIFEHLFASYRTFGETPGEALSHAAARVRTIRNSADRLLTAPHRGTRHDEMLSGLRHLTIDRAIFWFEIDETRQVVRVLAIFFGGQDHIRRMLLRLLDG